MKTNQLKLIWNLLACGIFLLGVSILAADAVTNAPARLLIVKAAYGDLSNPDAQADITKQVKAMVKDDALTVVASNDNFEDMASGTCKQLRVDFTIDGVAGSKDVYEHGTLKISVKDKAEPKSAAPKLVIRKAVYGVMPDGDTIDVTSIVTGMVKDDALAVNPNSDDFGDPAVGMSKKLRVDYTLNGKDDSKTAAEGETLKISAAGE